MAANKDVKLSNILNISSNFQLERIDDEDAKDAGEKKSNKNFKLHGFKHRIRDSFEFS